MFEAALERAVRIAGNSEAFSCGDERIGWSDLVERGKRLAAGYSEIGLKPGDRIATLLENGITHVELFVAAHYSGVVIVPLNFRWNAGEIRYALEDCGPEFLVTSRKFENVAIEAAAGLDTRVFSIDGEQAPSYALLYGDGKETPPPGQWDDLYGIFYTGGTTGRSKGVMLSHGNVYSNVLANMAEGVYGDGQVGLMASPFFHIAGALCMHCSFMSAARNVIMPTFDAGLALELIERERVNQSLLVPTMLGAIVDHPDAARADVSSVTNILYGASPMTPTGLRRAMALFTGARFTQLYGMTETAPTSAILHSNAFIGAGGKEDRIASVGRPIVGTEIRIVKDDGSEARRGEFGEICTRGAGVMQGYWNMPEATAEAIRDSWMYTGDGGYMDDDGFIFLADRLKDMIISGGENVFSVEVESVIAAHPAVKQVAVVGIPHEHWGEAVHAIVVLHEGQRATEQEIKAFGREQLAGFKTPRTVEITNTPLPLSAAGKILKRELRARYWPGTR